MENNNEKEFEENGLTTEKKSNFSWDKFWAWSSLFIAVTIPLVGVGVGILANSMATEENKKEVFIVSLVGICMGGFFALLDLMLEFVSLF